VIVFFVLLMAVIALAVAGLTLPFVVRALPSESWGRRIGVSAGVGTGVAVALSALIVLLVLTR
jgi:hypothetical protein